MILLNEARAAVARSRLGHVCRVRTSAIGPCRSGMLSREALTRDGAATGQAAPPLLPRARSSPAGRHTPQ